MNHSFEKGRTYPVITWAALPPEIRDQGQQHIRAVWLGEVRLPRPGEFYMHDDFLGAVAYTEADRVPRPIAQIVRVEYLETIVDILPSAAAGDAHAPVMNGQQLFPLAAVHAGLPDYPSLRAVATGDRRTPKRGEWYLAAQMAGEGLQAWKAVGGGYAKYPIARLVRLLGDAVRDRRVRPAAL